MSESCIRFLSTQNQSILCSRDSKLRSKKNHSVSSHPTTTNIPNNPRDVFANDFCMHTFPFESHCRHNIVPMRAVNVANSEKKCRLTVCAPPTRASCSIKSRASTCLHDKQIHDEQIFYRFFVTKFPMHSISITFRKNTFSNLFSIQNPILM